jgi:anti-sigma B factor antagonist
MAEASKPTFLVDATSDPVAVRIDGRASFQNSSALNDFFNEVIASGKTRFVMDFANCTSMDSTFLGVLAGVALQLRKQTPPGSLVVCRLAPRNLELVNNLGLHRLLTVDTQTTDLNLNTASTLAVTPEKDEVASARVVLAAHENLIAADEANRAKFQDVLTFLKGRISQG